jgi:type I restriction enzyme M protein
LEDAVSIFEAVLKATTRRGLVAQGVSPPDVFFDRKPGQKDHWTKTPSFYDLRTNKHFTLKTRRLVRSDLDEFVECYRPGNRRKRKATWSESNPEGRFRPYTYEEILARDKVSLDLFWLRDESLEDSANLPDPNILAQEIADDLRSALEQIEDILGDLNGRASRARATSNQNHVPPHG